MASLNQALKNKINRNYYQRHKERLSKEMSAKQKIKYHENPSIFLSRSKRSREKHYEKRLFDSAKASAIRRNLEFDIEISDIIIPEKCPYLKIPLTRIQGQGRIWSNASIDRVNNSKGYVKGNIEIISMKANVMKSSASYEELVSFSKAVLGIR